MSVTIGETEFHRLSRCRDMVRRVIDKTTRPEDCRPRGSFRVRGEADVDTLLDMLKLLDALCVATAFNAGVGSDTVQ
jgi:hypothetical protein